MKWMIASDIHGSAHYCKMMLEQYQKEGSAAPASSWGYSLSWPKKRFAKRICAKRGSLDAQRCIKRKFSACGETAMRKWTKLVLQFPILADYALLAVGKRALYATHGHLFSQENLPPLQEGDILLNGHTHVPKCTVHESYLYMNPGSVSLPKENSYHGYMTMEDGLFLWKGLQGEIKNRFQVEP